MENSKPLATESFSYSWLIDRKPSDQNLLINNNLKEHNFNFDVPVITPHDNNLVHADEIFSHGQIMPIYIERSNVVKTLNTSTSSNSAPSSPISDQLVQIRSNQYYLIGRWRKSSKRILEKCVGFVKPLCRRRKCNNSKVDDLDRKVFELRRWSYSVDEVSPRPGLSSAYNNSAVDVKSWRSSPNNISPSRISNACCDAENSIDEAILYCKRSNIGS